MRTAPFTQRLVVKYLAGISALFLLCSCGGGRPASSGAGRYIKLANEAEKQAMTYEEQGKDTEALSMYRDALEKLETGLKYALASERPQFRTIKERVEPKIAELEMRQKLKKEREEAAKKKSEEDKKVAALGKTDTTKDEDVKRKAEDEARKKEAAERAEQLKKLTEDSAAKTAQKAAAEGDDDPRAKTGGAAGGADGTAEGAAKKDTPKPPEGPFKTYGENEKPPRLSVDKVESRGEFIYAYIQIYNDDAKNKRIARPDVMFTTIKDADLCNADINIKYSDFNKTMPDPLEHTTGVMTLSSHEVFGTDKFQFVAIAKNKEKASRAKKAKVSIMFEDGSSWTARGPEDAKPSAVDGLPGL